MCICAYAYIRLSVCVDVFAYMCICIYLSFSMYMDVFTYNMCICVYSCVYVYVYVSIVYSYVVHLVFITMYVKFAVSTNHHSLLSSSSFCVYKFPTLPVLCMVLWEGPLYHPLFQNQCLQYTVCYIRMHYILKRNMFMCPTNFNTQWAALAVEPLTADIWVEPVVHNRV